MMTTSGDKEYVFVYSEMFKEHEDTIANRLGKHFVCGKVYVGLTPKEYIKCIEKSKLSAMEKMYPDAKIVAQGKIKDMKYVDPKTELNIDKH